MTEPSADPQAEALSPQRPARRLPRQPALNGAVALAVCCIVGVVGGIACQGADAQGAAAFDDAARSSGFELTHESGHPVLEHPALGIRVTVPYEAMEPAGNERLEGNRFSWSFFDREELESVTISASQDPVATEATFRKFIDALLSGMRSSAESHGVEMRVTSLTVDEEQSVADASGSIGPGYFGVRVMSRDCGEFHPVTVSVQAYSSTADHANETARSLSICDVHE